MILVSSFRYGSINHTLSSLEDLQDRKMVLAGYGYNVYGNDGQRIIDDSLLVIKHYIKEYGWLLMFCSENGS